MQGTLFTEDFLAEGIELTAPWHALNDAILRAKRSQLTDIFTKISHPERLNEAQTEERLVRPILVALGWEGAFSVQTNIDPRGRANVSDYTLFPSVESLARADESRTHDEKLKHAIVVADAKAFSIGLDQPGGGAGRGETPAAQVLRYLTRAETVSDRAVRYAMLTNGRHWRLYYSGAKSLLDDTFEVDLAWVLGLPGTQGSLTQSGGDPDRLLKAFLLFFAQSAFRPTSELGGRTFHAFARDEGRLWESKVRSDLARVVFDRVFPGLVRALAEADPESRRPYEPAYLTNVGDQALTLLYRLLFALYAEDRDLLPPRDQRYDDYALSTLRDRIASHVDAKDRLSASRSPLYRHAADLFRIIDEGDEQLGIPPYNGRLFSAGRAPLLDSAPLPDATFAPLLDDLSRTNKGGRRVRINFRDLSVRELGAIYEGLLVYAPTPDEAAEGGISIRLNPFGRKGSGSYYTPDELVQLIITRTVGPLVEERTRLFQARASAFTNDKRQVAERLADLTLFDPASRILDLKVCDPAMGSGHFLVALVDYLSEQVFTATAATADSVPWLPNGYVSPLLARLATIRQRIEAEAAEHGWAIQASQLTDQNLIKRVVLKRCVYGVDKNPMAVELAKLALWLNTFTAGAPLSFLDHHLRCGDSIYGERVRGTLDDLYARGGLLINAAVQRAEGAVSGMTRIEDLTDAEVAEVKASISAFAEVESATAPLIRFMDVWQALKWLDLSDEEKRTMGAWLDAGFGDPVRIGAGLDTPNPQARGASALVALLDRARSVAARERFFHWQPAFPGVWHDWTSGEAKGGFDAIVGNPPWDRMKMQEVEWFVDRAPAIARQKHKAARQAAIDTLKANGDPLADVYESARKRAERAMQCARKSGEYPLLSRGDINIYSLFVERAQQLLNKNGIAGLLTPSGILSDKSSERFLKSTIPSGRVMFGLDFFNKRKDGDHFFPDVYYRFKFCAFICSRIKRNDGVGRYAFFARSLEDVMDANLIAIDETMINAISPTSFLVPVIRSEKDFDIATRLADGIFVIRFKEYNILQYRTLFHMASDSNKFLTIEDLNLRGAYPTGRGEWRKGEVTFERVFEGKSIQAYDHRAASLGFYEKNTLRTGSSETTAIELHQDPKFTVIPRFFISGQDTRWHSSNMWALAVKDVTSTTNKRSVIAALVPRCAAGHTMPMLFEREKSSGINSVSICSNLNSFVLDFFARQKIHNNHFTLNIIDQLPLINSQGFQTLFGGHTALSLVRWCVLRLTYTADDMAAFAYDFGHVDAGGLPLPPFVWDEAERRQMRARLDALFFHLYGFTDEDDIRYILSTFPIVRRNDEAEFGCFLTEALILWHFRALAAGDTHRDAPETLLIRDATGAYSRRNPSGRGTRLD